MTVSLHTPGGDAALSLAGGRLPPSRYLIVSADPRRLAAIRTSEAQLQRVTADDIRRAAQTYLDGAKAWKLEVVPRAGAAAK